jgi:glycerophosphoryl diester phosphodiesterase
VGVANELPLAAWYQGRTLNFGHRGASHDAPANTIASFELAVEAGADGVELDVMLSKDGTAVVIHDETVDSTTDGHGPVSSFTLAELKTLDAGSYKGAQYAGARIPTLEEVFEAVGQRLLINIELKGMTARADGLEALVARLIAKHGMDQRVIISSFNPIRLRRFRQAAPHIPIGFLHQTQTPLPLRLLLNALLIGLPREADHPQQTAVTAEYLARMHAQGRRVNTWVVNDPARMAALRDLGVDLIMTDRPDVLHGVLGGG